MHPLYMQAAGITHDVISAAIEVHKDKGPGLLESIYEWCLCKELELRGYEVRSQKNVRIRYKDFEREESLKFDVLVNSCLLVEIKAVEAIHPLHKAQLLSYMKLLDIPLGLLFNFHVEKLIDGLSRLMLPKANLPA
jgi:GxxExxY protein